MKSQRGIALWVYLVAAGAIVAALGGLYLGIERHGYQRGAAAKQAEWDRANDLARAKQDERDKLVSDALAQADTERQAAQTRASDYNAKWQEARRAIERNGRRLAVCNAKPVDPSHGVVVAGGGEAPEAAGDVAGDPGGSGIRLTWDFVRLYDGAWTGEGGEPVFPPAAGFTPAPVAGAASPYSPGEVLDVHAENARRCSEDRREFRALIGRIERAEKAWEEANKP